METNLYSLVKAGFPVTARGLQAPELEEEAGEALVLYSGEINLQVAPWINTFYYWIANPGQC